MALLTSLVIFLLGWGIVYFIQHVITRGDSNEQETVKVVSPENEDSPYLILINANYPLEPDYVPTDLVELQVPADTALSLAQEAALATQMLFGDAQKQGVDLKAISAYRSYNDQQAIYQAEADVNGIVEGVESVSPGTSEHQTGLALDVSSADVGYQLVADFAETPSGQWIAENAKNYGFIIRYPEGKEVVTGTIYEPWHLRYVGVEDAKKITDNNLSLEEYMKKLSGVVDESSSDSDQTKKQSSE